MGLFGKKKDKEKEQKTCPICGGEIKFFSSRVLADGETICQNCENKVRNNYGLYYRRRKLANPLDQDFTIDNYALDDAIRHATLAEVKEIIAAQEEADAAAVAEYGDFANMFTVEDCWTIAPKAVDVGLKRAKLFKNRIVVQGRAAKGSFATGDKVLIMNGSLKTDAEVLQAYKNTGEDFDTELKANLQRKGCGSGEAGWLILDQEQLLPAGAVVVK
ncbi:MAG: DUF4428 domain-containing protein [Firmicutes bacterium]|nr:DUF4428 domain-containing protein [Bacillota bacterium]